MNGSEKQVKWAEDIKAQTMAKVAEVRKQFESDAAKHNVSESDPQYIAAIAIFDRCVINLDAKMDAKWWIDNRNQAISRQFVKQMSN